MTQKRTPRDMTPGEVAYIYFEDVDWESRTVDLDGTIYDRNVRTPTYRIRRIDGITWQVTSVDGVDGIDLITIHD